MNCRSYLEESARPNCFSSSMLSGKCRLEYLIQLALDAIETLIDTIETLIDAFETRIESLLNQLQLPGNGLLIEPA
jgi:hypothetical protein